MYTPPPDPPFIHKGNSHFDPPEPVPCPPTSKNSIIKRVNSNTEKTLLACLTKNRRQNIIQDIIINSRIKVPITKYLTANNTTSASCVRSTSTTSAGPGLHSAPRSEIITKIVVIVIVVVIAVIVIVTVVCIFLLTLTTWTSIFLKW